MAPTVKRSFSTPNMSSTAKPPYSTDKRRNKLGYHRTSVACGHCRRRKIRCLITKIQLTKEDTTQQGCCNNCIRLKKECSFHPVENTDRQPRSPSKPDISNNSRDSAASSPSPGLARGLVPDYSNGHPASVPVTPISERPNSEDGCRANGAPGPQSQIQISQSASESRRPSIARLNSGPLGIKPEEAFISLGEGVPRTPWEVPSQQEMPNLFGQYTGFQDPSTTYWRLNSPSICGGPHPHHQLHSMGSMASLTAAESLDSCDDAVYSPQGPSRMGSFDHSMGGLLGYPTTHSPEAADLGAVPDLRSASTSTASLTASISEASQYGAPGEPGYEHYMTQWVDQASNWANFSLESVVKGEDVAMDPQYLLAMGDEYSVDSDLHHFAYPGQHTRPIVKLDQE